MKVGTEGGEGFWKPWTEYLEYKMSPETTATARIASPIRIVIRAMILIKTSDLKNYTYIRTVASRQYRRVLDESNHSILDPILPDTPVGKTLTLVLEYGPGVKGHSTCEQRGSVVPGKGIPFRLTLYLAVPSATVTPSGIVSEIERVEFSPGTTGSGSKEASPYLKTEVPEEQSFTVLAPKTAVAANRAIRRRVSISTMAFIQMTLPPQF